MSVRGPVGESDGVIELVVTDLDGSLWHREEIHPASRAAWAEIEAREIPVLVATGRRLTTTREPLARAGLRPPAIVLNGALGLDLASGETFHRHYWDASGARDALDAFRDAGLEPCVYVEHHHIEVFVGSAPSTHPGHLASLGTRAVVADLDEILARESVLGFGVIGRPPEPLATVAEAIGDRAEAHLSPDANYGDAWTLTVAPPGLSKWAGVLAFCARAEVDPERVLAVGDGPNDHELLAHAAIAVVPDDASPGALALADHVVPSATEGGWGEIVGLLDP
jgi:hydroxymethylpyrimidine pyrophosphatase-like HAD family hydrolase